jgi:uncharacterized membrane protein
LCDWNLRRARQLQFLSLPLQRRKTLRVEVTIMSADERSAFDRSRGRGSQRGDDEGSFESGVERAVDSSGIDDQQLAQALGWFSIGLGVTEILAPRSFGRAIGVGDHPAVVRMLGMRAIMSGVGLLSERKAGTWAWSRVAGDAMDLALLGAATRSADARPERIAMAATAVLGMTALDVYSGQQLSRTSLQMAPTRVQVTHSVTINASPPTVYAFWRNLENLPLFMRHLVSVTATNDRTSHWVACAPAGATVEWDAEIVEDVDSERLAWRTLPDSEVLHEGTVTFEPAPTDRGTIVRVTLMYEPPAGLIGRQIAKVFGEEPGQQIREDLLRVKQLIETGEIATTAGQPHGERSFLGRTTLGVLLS